MLVFKLYIVKLIKWDYTFFMRTRLRNSLFDAFQRSLQNVLYYTTEILFT